MSAHGTYVGYPLTFWWDDDCTDVNEWCDYQEPHEHGFACEPTCPCKDRARWDR